MNFEPFKLQKVVVFQGHEPSSLLIVETMGGNHCSSWSAWSNFCRNGDQFFDSLLIVETMKTWTLDRYPDLWTSRTLFGFCHLLALACYRWDSNLRTCVEINDQRLRLSSLANKNGHFKVYKQSIR